MPCITITVKDPPIADIYIDSVTVDARKIDNFYTVYHETPLKCTIVFKNRGELTGTRPYEIVMKDSAGKPRGSEQFTTPEIPPKKLGIEGEVTVEHELEMTTVGNQQVCISMG